MGCNRYCTEEDLDQIIASADIDDPGEIDKAILAEAIENYGDAVADFVDAYSDSPEYADAILDTLNQLADIEGMDGVLQDLISGDTKGTGADFQLSYAFNHADEIAAVDVPFAYQAQDGHVYGREGIDVLNKDGSVTELKAFDFGSSYYSSHAEQVAESVVGQAMARLDAGATSVDVVFSGWDGPMPSTLADALNEAIEEMADARGIGSTQIEWRVE